MKKVSFHNPNKTAMIYRKFFSLVCKHDLNCNINVLEEVSLLLIFVNEIRAL